MSLAVDFDAATPLALVLDFSSDHPGHFGAPPATSSPFRSGSFEGEVARGASCNCRRITLVPHCNGTHTESASHLTVEQRPLHHIVPAAPIPALLLTVPPLRAADTREDSLPAPRSGDRQLTEELVSRGIQHLVTDLPSVDRLEDDGLPTAHRIFFGLPTRSTRLDEATRAQCTITELAWFPDALADGPCAVQLQIPAFGGDAVPSRPLHLPYLP